MLNTPFRWNNQNVAMLKDLLEKGHSASQAGVRLGCSKNAALSKAYRLGLTFGGGVIVAKVEARLEERKSTRVTTIWTDDELAKASKLWGEGKTAGQIAFAIGKTPFAINAKCQDRRDLFPFRHRTTNQPQSASQHAKVLNKVFREREQREFVAPEPPPEDYDTSAFEPSSSVLVPISRQLQLTELTDKTCKWPIGDPLWESFHFCGVESGTGSPYCTYHTRLAYRPVHERSPVGGRA